MDAARLRAEFPVLERLTYLNAGTDGPVPARAVEAARAELEREASEGRTKAHFERRAELAAAQRSAYARLLGCPSEDLALTTATSQGVAIAVAGLELRPGDEILTSDQEHPGLLGPLSAARRLRGVQVRMAPLGQLAEAVEPQTRLVACSHVSWVGGEVAPAGLGDLDGIPLLLDGAQSVGAVPVDVGALRCDVYAGSGQKWLCGPDGTGMLYVAPTLRERLAVSGPSYLSLADPDRGLDATLHPDARRFDTPSLAAETSAFALASLDVLAARGWDAVHARAQRLAGRLAELLVERGHHVAPRGETTLVAWVSEDPSADRARLADAGIVVRDLPGRPLLRASVGAWNDETDLERLVDALER